MASSLGPRAQRSRILLPNGVGDRVMASPRIIPINTARSFQKTSKPTQKMPLGVEKLQIPANINSLHTMQRGM